MVHWAARPVNTVLLLALVGMTFHHMHLGLQVVYEDYIHEQVAAERRHLRHQRRLLPCSLGPAVRCVSILRTGLHRRHQLPDQDTQP